MITIVITIIIAIIYIIAIITILTKIIIIANRTVFFGKHTHTQPRFKSLYTFSSFSVLAHSGTDSRMTCSFVHSVPMSTWLSISPFV